MNYKSPWDFQEDPIGRAYLSRMAKMDIALQQKIRRMKERLPLFLELRLKGGSRLRMAELLRWFLNEYAWRIVVHNPNTLPSSFNIVEAFLLYYSELLIFDLRQEREHLVSLQDYFDWYTSDQGIPENPKILIDAMQEGIIYSYDVVGDTGEFTITTEGSRLAIVGISMVRHGEELSIVLLSAENPPFPPDDGLELTSITTAKGREAISPSEDLSVKDRYLDGWPGFSKVLLLTRFNLVSKKHDVRYINLDTGKGYMVLTDDKEMVMRSGFGEKADELLEESNKCLERYKQLFSAVASLIYLPIMFVDQHQRVKESKFCTEAGTSTRSSIIKKAVKEFGKDALIRDRNVFCLTSPPINHLEGVGQRIVNPPDFKFESTGFWKPIGQNEIGQDKNGNQIVGKTWVERIERYSVKGIESFVISNTSTIEVGNDPGIIYIIRSTSHGLDLYKVGLTRRSVQERATEIGSSTGVPLPFDVLASWQVSDCASIEKEIHKQLKPYRVNKRREFFRTSLPFIVATVEKAIANYGGSC